ncbi:GSK-3-binding protein FRAT2-like [Schistocerca americana]|uniref:GSK-3-binding protein FRAT2-like n=1 Tax=Schistocerca americana TaxID=7009 RepID=UPI001F4FCE98|nr:GSK-3-binding protein FRAT2-like [Schistocerca americana]XP_047117618.1 GSK-3-binding protein FRAT2-like [Schistocerca piceifrons]XP_049762806.1 GSK-3-binding protein FRAT2-like [Schistocerca cancellata]XP_049816805.1 GSK-3-binding protein FRAT2-like [Schistocerca nitens]XP_049831698.1 GSK-3-binding protein FRAT2-like [Schistocerca gregaria]XP_049962986.1 LOW QUALITY PROTEIN: GSK-3-binding protein FRAT2-like [Schistocerca serialis cubense]
MPSKEEMCILSGNNGSTTQDFMARDMEELVSEIKENLRLSGLKTRSSFSLHKSRASPYRIPSRSWSDSTCDGCLKSGNSCSGHTCLTVNRKSSKSTDASTDDPYEMLQELLRDGSLIKEAVRRLQKGLSPKQRYFYDSDEDVCSPLRMCHLEI